MIAKFLPDLFADWFQRGANHRPNFVNMSNQFHPPGGSLLTVPPQLPDAHLKRQIMGREVVVAITNGKLDLGPWEAIFYGEFDGNRRKRVLVKIIGE